MKGKVSIIIPAFNVENYIGRGVSSALSQTYEDIEVVVVDDGSSDGTWSVLQTYSADSSAFTPRKLRCLSRT